MYVCVGRGGMLCGVPMHSRSRLQTNARGVETGVEGVYESSREKFWLRMNEGRKHVTRRKGSEGVVRKVSEGLRLE